VLAWIGYALWSVQARDASASVLMSQRWEQSLNDLHRPQDGDSLIPMFEGMVDRAFSRSPKLSESHEIERPQSVREISSSQEFLDLPLTMRG
jgi:hypothetical protein